MWASMWRLPRTSRYTKSAFGGFALAYILLQRQQRVIHSDSSSKNPWPKTKPIIAGSTNQKPTNAQDGGDAGNDASPDGEDSVLSKDEDVALFEADDSAAWAAFSNRFATARKSIASLHWSKLGDKIADQILPEWVQSLPGYIAKFQAEIDMTPDSLAYEIWEEARDPTVHPNIELKANVRLGKDLCPDEKAFIRRRKRYTTRALSQYLDIPEADIDPQDVPTMAICGSGGGLRALVAGTSSYLSAQKAGLFDCATYTAGVSGSCWLQTLYYSTIGGRRHDNIINHLRRRIGVHIAYPPSFLDLMTRAPTNKYLLSSSIEKLKGDPGAAFGIVDIYGLLLATRLLVPRDELSVDSRDLKLSNQRSYLADGQNPLPIYSAVRHEIPIAKEEIESGKAKGKVEAIKEKAKREAWFQWFEFTPYEVWCDDFAAGIPSWSVGREFSQGRSKAREDGMGLPELGIPFMLGIWGSAFCATLAHYYKEIRPIIKGLAGFEGLDDLIEGSNDDLIKFHPVQPGAIPNYALGLKDRLPSTCPESASEDEYIELMDAGMSNNLPIYPLLRKGRDVDVIVCFDASANIKEENWLSVVDGYAKQHGINGWPFGAGWPKAKDETKAELNAADAATAQQAAGKIADAREDQRGQMNGSDSTLTQTQKGKDQNEAELGYCNVWIGSTAQQAVGAEPSPSKRLTPGSESQLLEPDAGTAVIYFPFLPNSAVADVNPDTSPYLSTWNFIYSPEEVDKVVLLANANFEAGKEQAKRTVRAVYERKKARRLAAEGKERDKRLRKRVRQHGDHFQ